MICQKCGKNLPGEAKFCSGCGNIVSQASSGYAVSPDLEPAPMLGGNSGYDERTTRVFTSPAYSDGPRYETLADYKDEEGPRTQALAVLRSPIFMILGISGLFGVLLEFVAAFDALDSLRIFGFADGGAIVLSFLIVTIAMIPQLLSGIGFTVAAAKSRSGSCGGLGAAKASFIIMLVLVAIVLTIFVIAMIISLAAASDLGRYSFGRSSSYYSGAMAGMIIGMLFIVGLFVMMIIYYAKLASSLSVIQDAVNSNTCHRKSSIFAVVMTFIFATFSIVSIFAGLESGSLLLVFSSILSTVNEILLGIAIATIRKVDVSFENRSAVMNAYPAEGRSYPGY